MLPFLFTTALGVDLPGGTPSGEITAETPSLEVAYPGEMSILRTTRQNGDVIHYEVKIFSPEVVDPKQFPPEPENVAVVVCDDKGSEIFSASLELSGIAHNPPSTERFRKFSFSVHKRFEATTVINVGRELGRTVYKRYRLPLKTIDHLKAH